MEEWRSGGVEGWRRGIGWVYRVGRKAVVVRGDCGLGGLET